MSDVEPDDADAVDPDDRNALEADDANAVLAPIASDVLELLVTSLVDDPDAVRVDAFEQRGKVRLEVRVGPDDMGRVIGKRGRVAGAIRTVVRAAAVKDDVEVDIEFED
jgi:uncharacterized protein